MLKSMRIAAQSRIAKGLFIILVGSFAVWGIGPIFRGAGRMTTAAEAGNVKISTTEADHAFQQRVRQFEQQYGISLNAQLIAQLGFKQQVIQQIVMQSLYDQEASKLGLRLGNELVRQTIAAQPNFRNAAGQFDPNMFHQLLSQVGMSEAGYVQTLKGDIVRLMLMGGVRGSAQPSDTLARTYYTWKNERRVVEAMQVKSADMSGVPSPTEDDLNKYLTDHSDKYMAPEYRALSFAVINMVKVAEGIDVSADEIKAAYDAAPDSFGTPETRNILQITTQDQALAEKIATESASKPFEEVAKAHDLTPRPVEGMTRASILPELGDAVFTLEQGKPSQAIKSPMGWHVILVTKVTPGSTRTLEQAKNQIEAGIKMQRAQEQIYELTKKLQDTLAGGTSLADAAAQLGLEVTRIEATSHDGYKPDGTKIAGTSLLPQVLATAFGLQPGEPSQVQETDSGAYVVMVDSVTPAQVKPLAEVKNEISTAWFADKRLEMATAKATELAEKLRNGEAVRGMTRGTPLERDGSNRDKLPQTAISHIFSAKVGDVLTAEANDGVWIIKLAAINPAMVDGVDLSATRAELKDQMANDILEQFGNALRSSYGVTINDKWLQQSAENQ